jgi:hypothetical protein
LADGVQLSFLKLSIALRSDAAKKHSTPSHKADIRRGGHTKTKKNNDHFNLSLCLLWFLGGFVFEDSFAKKRKI